MINLVDYRFIPTMMPEDVSATPACITAVHKERYEIICEYGQTFVRLKTSSYPDGLKVKDILNLAFWMPDMILKNEEDAIKWIDWINVFHEDIKPGGSHAILVARKYYGKGAFPVFKFRLIRRNEPTNMAQ